MHARTGGARALKSKSKMLRPRLVCALALGLGLVLLALHNAHSLRLRDLLARQGNGELWRRAGQELPLPLGVIAAMGTILLAVGCIALWRILGRIRRPDWLPTLLLTACLGAAATLVDWNAPHLPLQWSLIVLPYAGLVGVAASFAGSARSFGRLLGVGAAALALLMVIFQPSPQRARALQGRARAATQTLRKLAERYETQAPNSYELVPAMASPEAIVRIDERFEEFVLLDAAPADPEEGLLARVPQTHRLEGFRGVKGRQFELDQSPMRLQDYSRGALLRTEPAFALAIEDVQAIRIRMRVSRGSAFSLYWNQGDRFDRLVGMRIPLAEDRGFYTYELSQPLEGISTTYGIETLDHLYLAPSDQDADVEIEFIEIRSTLSTGGQNLPVARGYENVAGEMRRVLSVRHGTRFELTLSVPKTSPRLELGWVAARGSAPSELSIFFAADGKAEQLLHENVGAERSWTDRRIDLADLAGRTGQLRVENSSTGAGMIHLSNPSILGAAEPTPNVIIYLVDCLRADHDGLDRYAESLTPNMDRFGGEGVRFTSAYSNGCTTKLSVPSLMSSNPVTATGVRHADGIGVLAESFTTLPEALRSAGYATGAVTSNSNLGSYSGTHQGFSWLIDQYIAGGIAQAHAMHHPDMDGSDIVQLSLDWLGEHADRPFFLYVHTLDSHGPYDPPERYRLHYEALQGGTPVERNARRRDPDWVQTPTLEGRRALYDGTVQYSDELFQRFLEGLDALGHLDDTLVILTADHGEYFGEHEMWTHGPPPFVQGTHIPLMMRWPGHLPAGSVVAENVQLMDVMPTILDAAALVHESPLLQGQSVLPLIEGSAKPRFEERAIFVEGIFRTSVHIGQLHYMGNADRLFDLQHDPEEVHPLSRWTLALPAKQSLQRLVDQYQRTYTKLNRAMNRAGAGSVSVSPETLDQLRALGYID